MFTNKLIKLLVAVCLIAIAGTLPAQDIKDKSVEVSKIEFIEGVILPLNETQKIRYEYPEKLKYWDLRVGPKNLHNYLGSMKPKQEQNNKKPVDYKFVFVSSGLEYKGNSGPKPFKGGKVIELMYQFPCQLEVRDANDNLLKIFILDDGTQEHTTTYSPDFFAYELASSYIFEVEAIRGFALEDEQLLKKFVQDENDILARVEYNKMARLGHLALNIIYAGYGGLKTSKPSVLTLENKYKNKFPELDAAIEKLIADIVTFYMDGINDQLQKKFAETGQYFASQYNDESSKNMKKICSYNSALAYSLAGLHEEAYRHLQVAISNYGLLSYPSNLEKIFDSTTLMYQAIEAKDVDVFKYKEAHTSNYRRNQKAMADRKKAQGEMSARLAYNVDKKSAVVVDKDGKEHNGLLELTVYAYQQKESGILDLDFGKVCLLTYEDGKGKYFKTGNTKYIKVDDVIYEPVKEKESLGLKLMKATQSEFSGTYFLPRVFESGNYAVYYNVQGDYHLIKNKNSENAYSFGSLLGGSKDAKAFREGCSELVTKIENKEIENNLEGAKIYVRLLTDCKK